MSDFYAVLGVPQDATVANIRKAYITLARDRHPDRFADPAEKKKAEEFFTELTAAFNTLSNERSRREYDQERAKPKLTDPVEIARDAYTQALKHAEARDLAGAAQLLRAAVHHAPNEARYHAALGRVLALNPQWVREAVEAYEAAMRLDPRHAPYYVALARVLLGKGMAIRARKLAETAFALAPSDPEVLRLATEVGIYHG